MGYYDPFETEAGLAMMGGLLIVYLVVLLISLALSITMYIMGSLGTYKIAKRRGIHNPWLSWIPVGNMWVLGSISDHYQHVAKGKERKYRHLLLWLTVGVYAGLILFFIVYFVSIMGATVGAIGGGSGEAAVASMLGVLSVALIFYFVVLAVSIVTTVFQYIALYDLFRSCKPQNAVLFLILSILVNVTYPFFIFACRNADEGMPPKIRSSVN